MDRPRPPVLGPPPRLRRGSRVRGLVSGLLATLALACAPAAPPADGGDGAASRAGEGAGTTPALVDPECRDPLPPEVRWAAGFAVESRGDARVLDIRGETGPRRFVLVCRGAPAPELDGEAAVIEIPIRRLATTSTTELAPLEPLGVLETWVGHADLRFVTSRALRRRVTEGHVAEIGGADGLGLDVERLLELSPDVLLIDSSDRVGGDRLALLASVGTAVVPMPSFRERSPLARAEWLKVTALLTGRGAEAARLFAEIEGRYLELERRVAEHLASAGEAARPMVLTGGPWQGVWHVAGGDSFMARLLADAGGAYPWAESPGVGPLQLDIERVFERAAGADFWLYPSHWRSLDEITGADARLAAFAAHRGARVYAADRRMGPDGGNDFWQLGVHRPDLVLADLVAILHPDLLPAHELTFHRRLEGRPPAGEGEG